MNIIPREASIFRDSQNATILAFSIFYFLKLVNCSQATELHPQFIDWYASEIRRNRAGFGGADVNKGCVSVGGQTL